MPALILKICRDEAPPLPPPWPDWLRSVTARLLVKDPSQRPLVADLLAEPSLALRVDPLLSKAAEREQAWLASAQNLHSQAGRHTQRNATQRNATRRDETRREVTQRNAA